MARTAIKPKHRPQHGPQFLALFVTDSAKRRSEIEPSLHRQGIVIRHFWRPVDSPVPLADRPIPDDTEIVIIDGGAAIKNQERKRLAYEALNKRKLFTISEDITTAEMCRRFTRYGYEAAPYEAPEPEPAPPSEAAPIEPEAAPTVESPPMEAKPAIRPCRDMKEAGELIAKLRQLQIHPKTGKPITTGQLAAMVGVSGSYISAIEKGKKNGGAVSGAICTVLERIFNLPTGTLPRLATRENRRLSTIPKPLEAIAAPPAPKPAPPAIEQPAAPPAVVAPPPPAPPAPPARLTPDQIVGAFAIGDLEVFLGAVRRRMADLGLDAINVTPTALALTYKA